MIGFAPQSRSRKACIIALALALPASWAPISHAALTVGATRVVFDSNKRSTSVTINNPSNRPFAVQTWVNTAADDNTTAVPFIPSPPLFRLDPGKEQQVQINGLPTTLPGDRESLFYFNVQEIPQASTDEGNVLSIALRTRLKLFYRPHQLTDNPMSRLTELQWSITRTNGMAQLVVHNPTPFHVSFIRLELAGNGLAAPVKNAYMVAPFDSQAYAIDMAQAGAAKRVVFAAINDYGGYSEPLTVALPPSS